MGGPEPRPRPRRRARRWDEAVTWLDEAVPLLQGDRLSLADALRCRGMAHRSLGRIEPALASLEPAAALYAEMGVANREADCRMMVGSALRLCPGREADAETELRKALEVRAGGGSEGMRAVIQTELGELLVRLERGAEARPLLAAALDTLDRSGAAVGAPARPVVSLLLGLADLAVDALPAARQHLSAADPAEARVIWGLGCVDLVQGELEAAGERFAALAGTGPWAPSASLGLAQVHLVAHRLGAAAEALERVEGHPANVAFLRAAVYQAAGRPDEAVAGFEAALACDPPASLRATVLAGLAVALSDQGHGERALQAANDALATVPEHAPGERASVHARVGLVQAAQGRLDEARASEAIAARYADQNGIGPRAELSVWLYRLRLALA